jgi:predicted PurR-regulated permease PerM
MWVGVEQLTGVLRSLPDYRANIVRKLERLRNLGGQGVVGTVQRLDELKAQVDTNRLKSETNDTSAASRNRRTRTTDKIERAPVEVAKPGSTFLPSIGLIGTSVMHYVAMVGGVVVLTLFMLLNRAHLRNRLFRLLGQGHLVLMRTALDDAAQRVSRYLLTQSLVNSCFGAILALGLYWIGVPYAAFWGGLAAFLRFIPYVGTFIAGACPAILAAAVFTGWKEPLLTLGLYLAIEVTTSSFVEPWLYATRTGISSLAILLSAAFWTLLWGPIGLVLSTPLTVCLAVLGRHLPPLEVLYVLLGDEPALTPEVSYYERLLAMDEDGAAEVVETCLKDKSLEDVYDSVLIPALGLAERDRHQNRLDSERAKFILQTTRDFTEEFAEQSANSNSKTPSIVCLPARDEADEIAGLMLIQILKRAGHNAELLRSAERIEANTVVISALPPFAVLPARSLCRQLRKTNPDVTIVLGIWNSGLEPEKITQRLGASCFDRIAITLVQAVTDLTADNDAEPERARLVEVPEKGGLSDPSRLSDKSL